MEQLLSLSEITLELFHYLDCYSFLALSQVSKQLNFELERFVSNNISLLESICKKEFKIDKRFESFLKYLPLELFFTSKREAFCYWRNFAVFCCTNQLQRRLSLCDNWLKICYNLRYDSNNLERDSYFEHEIIEEMVEAVCTRKTTNETQIDFNADLLVVVFDVTRAYRMFRNDSPGIACSHNKAMDLACEHKNYWAMRILYSEKDVMIREHNILVIYNRGDFEVAEEFISDCVPDNERLSELFDLLIKDNQLELMRIYLTRQYRTKKPFEYVYKLGITVEMFQLMADEGFPHKNLAFSVLICNPPLEYLIIAVQSMKKVFKRRRYRKKLLALVDLCKTKEQRDYLIVAANGNES